MNSKSSSSPENEFAWTNNGSSNKSLPLNIFQLSLMLIMANIIIQGLGYLLGYFSTKQAVQFIIISVLIIIAYFKISNNDHITTYKVNRTGIMVDKKLYLWTNISQVNVSYSNRELSLELLPKARLKFMPSIRINNETDMNAILSIINGSVNVNV